MPRKIRQLLSDLRSAGFVEVKSGGKGSHRKFLHPAFSGAVTVSGKAGEDAKPYQEQQVSCEGAGPSRSRLRALWTGRRGGEQVRPSDRYHKWIEWSDQDGVYLGRCPDVITGIHGSDPIRLYDELCAVVDEVLTELERSERTLPAPRTRPMREVA